MIKSMTGFGRAAQVLHGREIAVELKGVNARYFEYSSRIPRSMNFLDEALKKAVGACVARGKVELHLSVQMREGAEMAASVNMALAKGYHEALAAMCSALHIDNTMSAGDFARLPEVLTLQREEADEGELAADVQQVLAAALVCYNEMRAAEAQVLLADVQARLSEIECMVGAVEAGSAGRLERYTARLYERLREILQAAAVDEGRMLAEAALFADKTAVAEETVRLRSHLAQYREILAGGGAVGRKLDFLTQELNREANTIGSKCQEVEITRLVVDMKAEIEKIREQIQNLE